MNSGEPFVFRTERRLVALTGRRASNLEQLTRHLREVPGSSIFYHTHHNYLAHHFVTAAASSDLALWVGEVLQEDELGEKLAAVDLLAYTTIRDLREAILHVIENPTPGLSSQRTCPSGEEFHFCRSKSFIMATGVVAHDPKQLFDSLPLVSNISMFFHFFEARLRLGNTTNDFSEWLGGRGEEKLARAIDAIDAYSLSLDELKARMIALGKGRWPA